MQVKQALVGLGLVAVVGLAGGCGSSSSSSPSGSGAPTSASKTDFCNALQGAGSSTSPSTLADRLESAGTPSNIDSASRHGFEVLVSVLRKLPNNPQNSDLTKALQNAKPSDATDVEAFVTYLSKECLGGTSLPSAPSS